MPAKPSTLSGTSFLEEVAEAVLAEPRPQECAVVLPSHRAKAAFFRACARMVKKACRLPQAFTLSGFVINGEESEIADSLETLAVLYSLQMKGGEGSEGFDSFLSWGPVALADFNAIDLSNLDAQTVFKNLEDIKGIEEWSFTEDEEKWSEDMQRFSSQWKRLHPLYNDLHVELKSKGQTTLARATRNQGEKGIAEGFDKVFIAGLGAINESQKRYLDKWDKKGKLVVMWDGDKSYAEDEQVEAGFFIRDYKGASVIKAVRDGLSERQPEIIAVDCSSIMSACQYVREQVMELSAEERDRTVIVVPDASSLPVLLQALPSQKDGYNVTMGMSLRETPIYSFLNLLHRIVGRAQMNWRHEELMAIVNQPVIVESYSDAEFSRDARNVLHKLAAKHLVWVDEKAIKEHSKGAVYEFIQTLKPLCTDDADEYLNAFVVWANSISEKLSESKDPWVKSGWDCVRKVIAMVLRLQESHSPCKSANDVRAVMKRLLSSEKIDLIGEPAQGLQIMGLTETRALDYDNVMVLDCNEGMLPKHEIEDSFIPLDLKHAHSMPGRYEKEATYAYSFYRLLNRSMKVHLIYKAEGATNDGTEASRYLLQLRSTFKPGGNLLEIENLKFNMPLPKALPSIPPLVMSDDMRKKLEAWAQNGMSPSAINKMVSCERNFAYMYLLKLQEQKDLQENMQSNTIGSIVHFVFEEGFKGLKNIVQTPQHFNAVLKNLDSLLMQATKKYYNYNIAKKGENLLLIESARSTIQKLLKVEKEEIFKPGHAPVVLKGIEEKLSAEYTMKNGSKIKFYGLADKLEEEDGLLRVVDYKTGKADKKKLTLVGDFKDKLDKGDHEKAIQLLVYCAMLLKNEPHRETVSAGIRSGRFAKKGLLSLEIDGSEVISRDAIEKLIEWIQSRLEDLASEEREIEHNHDANYCQYCVVLNPNKKYC